MKKQITFANPMFNFRELSRSMILHIQKKFGYMGIYSLKENYIYRYAGMHDVGILLSTSQGITKLVFGFETKRIPIPSYSPSLYPKNS